MYCRTASSSRHRPTPSHVLRFRGNHRASGQRQDRLALLLREDRRRRRWRSSRCRFGRNHLHLPESPVGISGGEERSHAVQAASPTRFHADAQKRYPAAGELGRQVARRRRGPSIPHFHEFLRRSLRTLSIGRLGFQHNPCYVNDPLLAMGKENDPIVARAFAVVALPRLALERFHIALERILLHLGDTAGNLPPSLSGQRPSIKSCASSAILTTQFMLYVAPQLEPTFLDLLHPVADFLRFLRRQYVIRINHAAGLDEHAFWMLRVSSISRGITTWRRWPTRPIRSCVVVDFTAIPFQTI